MLRIFGSIALILSLSVLALEDRLVGATTSTVADAHAYFTSLQSRADMFKAYSLRDAAQLKSRLDGGFSQSGSVAPAVTYDPANDYDPNRQDAAKVVIPPGVNSLPNQVRLPLGTSDGHTYLVTWDAMWTESFLPSKTGLTTHKTFQLADQQDGSLWLETRTRFDGGWDDRPRDFDKTKHIATIDVRSYNTSLLKTTSNATSILPLRPQMNTLVVDPNKWVRFWCADRSTRRGARSREPVGGRRRHRAFATARSRRSADTWHSQHHQELLAGG